MKKTITCLCLSIILFVSCQPDDNEIVTYKEGTYEYTNQWMYEQMKRYYYWNDFIPNRVNLSLAPQDFFKSLLYSDDPFSYAYHTAYPETYPQSLAKSYGFDIGFKEFEGQTYGVVLYTLVGSPAQNAGLVRGDLITNINGINLTSSNANSLYSELISAEEATITYVDFSEENGFSNKEQLHISQRFTLDQPIHNTIIKNNGVKIGYIYFSHFDKGMAQNFVQIFEDFKNQQVHEIVLDLRYNGGGDVSSAAALCAIVAPNINADDLFIKFEGNENGGVIYQSFQEAIVMNETQIDFNALRAVHPSINRVFVLMGARTASASELVLNNLKPYMQVVGIGETTVGKDVAGFAIKDERLENTAWVINPSIYKLSNANEEGNYKEGIEPAYYINELEKLEIQALGSTTEILLSKALEIIK